MIKIVIVLSFIVVFRLYLSYPFLFLKDELFLLLIIIVIGVILHFIVSLSTKIMMRIHSQDFLILAG